MVQFFDPTQEQEIKRRRKMAEMLMQQGAPKPTEIVGGYAVPQSGLGQLARGLSGAVGSYQSATADTKEQELAKSRQELLAKAVEQWGSDPKAAAGTLMQDPSMMKEGLGIYGEAMKNDRAAMEAETQYAREDMKFQREADLKRELATIRANKGGGSYVDPDTNEIVQGSPAKPLPVGALKMQDESVAAIGGFNNIAQSASDWAKKLREGEVPVTPMGKIESAIRNKTGFSDEGSREYGSFNTFVEKMRNDLLLLAKGVQTEGDAKRALAAIVAAGNDPQLLADAMEKAAMVNQKAANLEKGKLSLVRKNYGLPDIDLQKVTGQPQQPSTLPAGAKQVATSGGKKVYQLPDGSHVMEQ